MVERFMIPYQIYAQDFSLPFHGVVLTLCLSTRGITPIGQQTIPCVVFYITLSFLGVAGAHVCHPISQLRYFFLLLSHQGTMSSPPLFGRLLL